MFLFSFHSFDSTVYYVTSHVENEKKKKKIKIQIKEKRERRKMCVFFLLVFRPDILYQLIQKYFMHADKLDELNK